MVSFARADRFQAMHKAEISGGEKIKIKEKSVKNIALQIVSSLIV